MRDRTIRPTWAALVTASFVFFALLSANAQTAPNTTPPTALEESREAVARGVDGARNSDVERAAEALAADQVVRSGVRAEAIRDVQSDAEAEAGERERAAMEKLQQARQLEEKERNDALRTLRVKEREFAEEALEHTREHNIAVANIYRETRQNLEALAERKSELLDALDEIPQEATQSTRRQQVDPLFDQLLELRAEAHQRFSDALQVSNDAERRLASRTAKVEEARKQLERAEQRLSDVETSLWERRVAVARARLQLDELREFHQREIVDAYDERVRDYHSQFGFFAPTIEPLLDRISDQRRSAYFNLGDTTNWQMAVESLRTGVFALEERVEHRLEQLDATRLTSLEFVAWLWRLFYTLAGLLLFAYVVIHGLIWLIDRTCAGLLRRRLLVRQTTVLVKLAEILRAISRPAHLYIGVAFTANYAAQSIPELLGLVWIVDAVFIYLVVMQACRVAILPRSHRREAGEVSAEELDYLDEARADNMADIIGVDLVRAKKLLNSIRVVTVFWLFAAYLPDFLKPLTGITVLWWLLDRAATWGVIVVIYWVLSRWRDEIAALFGKLAGDSLRPAVGFVDRHKNRPWGVLVIGVTSLYVLGKEIVIVVRRYVLETNIFKQLNALAFRTQIELQNRSRGKPADLADDYVEYFREHPLTDESYRVDRPGELTGLLERFEAWKTEKRRGSVAISGDRGLGKTTLLNQFCRELADEPFGLIRKRFTDRVTTREGLLAFAADVFELDEVPADPTELVAALTDLDSKVVVLDDCHLAFGRHIEQFGAIDALMDLVHLSDSNHFFVLAFERYAWRYIDRVEDRGHHFGAVIELEAWSPEDLQLLIEARNEASDYSVSFASLVAAHADTAGESEVFDIIETSRGYYGYLHQFSNGNPRVAIRYWLESLHGSERDHVLDVDLFERPEASLFASFSDDHWFMLSALVQHGKLNAAELAEIMDKPVGQCTRALDFFADHDVVVACGDERVSLSARFFGQVVRRLRTSRYLFGG